MKVLPTRDDRITCAVCAWRGSCAKKFSKAGQISIHCQDFTRDVTIKRIPDSVEEDNQNEKEKLNER